jgi:hypothetical protein
MTLEVQIQSIVYSFVFGMAMSLFFNILYKFLFNNKVIIKFISTEVFIITNLIIYFTILRKINYGIVTYYFIIIIIIGFLIGNRKTKLIRTYCPHKKEQSNS